MAYGVQCTYCGRPPTPDWRYVSGWAHLRGAEGGIHHLLARQDSGQRICERCLADLKAGLQPGSPRLF